MTKEYIKRQFSNFYNEVIKGNYAKSEDIENINNDFSTLGEKKVRGWQIGDNRFNPSTVEKGFLTSATNISGRSGTYYTSDYIDISDMQGSYVYFMRWNNSAERYGNRDCRYAFYDKDKNGIDYQASGIYVEIPQEACFLRISDDFQGNDEELLNECVMLVYSKKRPIQKIDFVDPTNEQRFLSTNAIPNNSIPIEKIDSRVFYCGVNEKYTSLRECIAEAIKIPNSKVVIRKGNYDLIEDFKDDLDTYNRNESLGIFITNGIHIFAEQGAKITFNYEGNNSYIHTQFSPFVVQQLTDNIPEIDNADVTLENVYIEAKNCRYIIHDEHANDTRPYCNKYLNCHFDFDNSNNPNWSAKQCIGGGLGQQGTVIIDSCYGHSLNNSAETITYHNPSGDMANSKIIIKNCYLDGVKVTSYGTSSNTTKFYCNGNSLKVAPNIGTDTPINVEMYAWNNEIRG